MNNDTRFYDNTENAEERKTDHGGGTEHKRGSPARETRRVEEKFIDRLIPGFG